MTRLQSNLKIGSLIKSGHFGSVYAAKDDVHEDVAVKAFVQAVGESGADWKLRRDALLREGQRLSQAKHDNVVQVFHLLEADSNEAIHLIMEFCDGGSLQEMYEAGPIRLAAVRKFATHACLGLAALHARGMLHRDIKPGNLLLSGNTLKLGDFGLVTDNIIFGYGSQAGYSDHIAPEVWNGSGTSARSDIWALGMTIYRLLHGSEWYSRSPAPQLSVPAGGFAKRLKWLPHIPDAWRRFVRKMLADDPHSRYQNADQVLAALARLPAEPDWNCDVSNSKIEWRRKVGERRVCVEWVQHTQRKFTWRAWSEPVKFGRTRSLGQSVSEIGYSQSDLELCEFFKSQS